MGKHISKEEQDETNELEKTIWFIQFNPYMEAISVKDIIQETSKDETLIPLAKAVKKGYINKKDTKINHYQKFMEQLTIADNDLIMKRNKIILPEALIERAMSKAHQGSHPGITAMKRRLRAHFYFPKLSSRITEYVNNCEKCMM